MPRKTRKTIRRYPPIAKEMIKVANDLHRASASLMRLAEKVGTAETDSAALQRFMATMTPAEDAGA